MMSIYDHFTTGTIKSCLYLASFQNLIQYLNWNYISSTGKLIHFITNSKPERHKLYIVVMVETFIKRPFSKINEIPLSKQTTTYHRNKK